MPAGRPLRAVRQMIDEALREMSGRFDEIYPEEGRRSIAPERLLCALLVQILHSIPSERMLMEQMEYSLLFRWFVGLSANEPVLHSTVFTKNRDRLLEGVVAEEFFPLNRAAGTQLLMSTSRWTVPDRSVARAEAFSAERA